MNKRDPDIYEVVSVLDGKVVATILQYVSYEDAQVFSRQCADEVADLPAAERPYYIVRRMTGVQRARDEALKALFIIGPIFVMLLLFAVTAKAEPGFIVYGDSQSFWTEEGDASKNWPHILQAATGRHFFNLSRGGRKLSDGHVAAHLRLVNAYPGNQSADTVLVALGGLDALYGDDVKPALLDAVQEATGRGFDVVCLLPPDNNYMTNEAVRADVASLCPSTIDLSLAVGPEDMSDPVHFTEAAHANVATHVLWALLLLNKF